MTAPQTTGRSDTLVIGLVAFAHLLSHFYQVVLGPLFPLLKEEFGVSYTELGLTISVLYGVSGVCQAFVGILVDRYGGDRLMLAGVVVMSTAVLLMGFAPTFWVLLPLVAIAALGNSVFHPADLSILSQKVHPSRLGRAFAIHGFGGTCGYFFSPIVVYYGVTSIAGWRSGLIVAGLIGLAAALFIWRFRFALQITRQNPGCSEERGGKADIKFYRNLVTNVPLMSAFFYFVLVAAALAGMQGFTVTALVERFDTPLHLAAAGVTAYFFGGAVGILLGGEIADRFRYPALIASSGLGLAAVLMFSIGLFDMSITMIICIMCAVGFWSGITQPSRDILVKGAAPTGASGKTFGFVYSGLDLGGALGPLYFGYLMDGGQYNEVFLVIGGLYAMAIFTILQLRQRQLV